MTEKIFDSRYMRKTRPEIPKYYQPDGKKRRLGIISPSCRLIHYDADFEIEAFKYMCWKRKLDRYQWKVFKSTMAKQEYNKWYTKGYEEGFNDALNKKMSVKDLLKQFRRRGE